MSDFHDNRPTINALSTKALTIVTPDIDMMSGVTVFIFSAKITMMVF